MIEAIIKALVDEHYKDPNANILLLSNIGMALTDAKLWPPANDKRTLFDAADATPGIKTVRDKEAPSFIPVVLEGDEERANGAINARRQRAILRTYPRALLFAFTLDKAEGQVMTVRLGPKITYQGGPAVEEGTILVDDDLRLPGLNVLDLPALGDEQVEQLRGNIDTWCERHGIEPSSLARTAVRKSVPLASASTTARSSALDRLYAAQDPEVARRLTVPIDIAIALSRMP